MLQAPVNISTDLKTVIGISETNQVIELKIEIKLEWYENRAYYYNLKEDSAFNVLAYEELAQMWIPYIIFSVSFVYLQGVPKKTLFCVQRLLEALKNELQMKVG